MLRGMQKYLSKRHFYYNDLGAKAGQRSNFVFHVIYVMKTEQI